MVIKVQVEDHSSASSLQELRCLKKKKLQKLLQVVKGLNANKSLDLFAGGRRITVR